MAVAALEEAEAAAEREDATTAALFNPAASRFVFPLSETVKYLQSLLDPV